MAWYFVLWIVLAIVIAFGATVVAGFYHDQLEEDPVWVVVGAVLIVALFPVIIAIGVLSAPFVGLYYLGKYLRHK